MRQVYFVVSDSEGSHALLSALVHDLNTLPEDFEDFINNIVDDLDRGSTELAERVLNEFEYSIEGVAEYLRLKTKWDISIVSEINIEYHFDI